VDWIANPDTWVALVTLTVLEIVLGIDNVVFLAILVDQLPARQRAFARQLGLALAMLARVALLFAITWIARLTTPLFAVLGHGFSGRDVILLAGGLFLIAKSTQEIHGQLEGEERHAATARASLPGVIAQILLLDVVFSLDSVITAVGLANQLPVMVAAVVIAVGVMLVAAGPISAFVGRHPTVKMLALSFLLLIGMALAAEGFGQHISKGYLYFAMAFSALVELLNLRARRRAAKEQPPDGAVTAAEPPPAAAAARQP
jgi:predicted tellurium resistance membrane protein TerC